MKDRQNYLHKSKVKMINGGDWQSLKNHLKHKHVEDRNFFYTI